jgi:hypothetical protein
MSTMDLMLSGASILLGSNEPKLLSITMPTIETAGVDYLNNQ